MANIGSTRVVDTEDLVGVIRDIGELLDEKDARIAELELEVNALESRVESLNAELEQTPA